MRERPAIAPEVASFIQRFPDALRNHGWIVVRGEENGPLESLRPRDEDFESPSERVGRDPGFVRPGNVLPAGVDCRLNALTSSGWDALGFKNREGHCDLAATLSPTSACGMRPTASFELPPFSCALRPKSSVSPSWASPQRWRRQIL